VTQGSDRFGPGVNGGQAFGDVRLPEPKWFGAQCLVDAAAASGVRGAQSLARAWIVS
jgi:hypothetical protein